MWAVPNGRRYGQTHESGGNRGGRTLRSKAHQIQIMQTVQRFRWCCLMLALTACAHHSPRDVAARAPIAPLEELPCLETPAPRAGRRAAQPVQNAGTGTLVLQLVPRDSLRAKVGAQFQLWTAGGGSGGPIDSVGSATLADKLPGLYRLGVRAAASQPRAWSYVFTVRAGLVDTIWLDLDARCTQIAKAP